MCLRVSLIFVQRLGDCCQSERKHHIPQQGYSLTRPGGSDSSGISHRRIDISPQAAACTGYCGVAASGVPGLRQHQLNLN
ncbi:hypothetical protein TgHK011_009352 [Trichoderma gracile]|nr:hypothetical protein TgHK011_009352 [Trichoderma gracile]